jgi:hypothetical protein
MSSHDRPLVPHGTHLGILYQIRNLGTRLQEYLGKPKEYKDTLVTFTFEFPHVRSQFDVKNDDGSTESVDKPLVLSREFVLSMGAKSNLRPFVEGILGVKLTDEEAYAFNLEDLLGKACLVSVIHRESKTTGKTYANIAGTTPLMKGMEVPERYNSMNVFDINTATEEEIATLPEFIQEKVKVSDEYKKRFGGEEEVETPFK